MWFFKKKKEKTNLTVFASTIIRNVEGDEYSGYLYKINWDSGNILKKIPILSQNKETWNERGGNRGGRGVSIFKDRVYLATAVTIYIYDFELNLLGEITNDLFKGLHELFIVNDGIWVTCTLHDLILKVDFEGNTMFEWWGSNSKYLQTSLGFESRELNLDFSFPKENFAEHYDRYSKEERLHINTVWVDDNNVYILANRKNALIKIYPNEKIVFQDNNLMSPHNGILSIEGNFILNNTQKQKLHIYSKEGRFKRSINTKIYKEDLSSQFAKSGWQRGLNNYKKGKVLIGTSPATIFELDYNKGKLGKKIKLEEKTTHCIHGLTSCIISE
ncbi:hypothetical protein LPB138_01845 [Urechidicola croceus]|uniref:Uncharacterized protein n=2 Tax=Urechidicola croceus TaxID=1850246 RepID=A0A1D8P4M2_9FLAO|nr:hypothetical protein LPB138_01845 [Urechidicola croceus]